jgi:hypothetical protein
MFFTDVRNVFITDELFNQAFRGISQKHNYLLNYFYLPLINLKFTFEVLQKHSTNFHIKTRIHSSIFRSVIQREAFTARMTKALQRRNNSACPLTDIGF